MAALAALLAACGSDDETDDGAAEAGDDPAGDEAAEPADDADDAASGAIDGAPPAGQAVARVDGYDLTFEIPGPGPCTVSDDTFTYSFVQGDNEVTLAAGVNGVDGGWMGSISLTIANPPDGEAGPIAYYPAPGDQGVFDEPLFVVDGNSVMYDGPMLKQPANDGSLPEPIDVGTGVVIATCE